MGLAGEHGWRWVEAEWTEGAFWDGPSCFARVVLGGAGTGQVAPCRACAQTDRTCCRAISGAYSVASHAEVKGY